MPKNFGQEVIGKKYATSEGVEFKVMEIEAYPKLEISERYLGILDLALGQLVAVRYRGTLIPNITLKGGVVRITKAEIDGQIFSRPKTISAALGIKEAMKPYELR